MSTSPTEQLPKRRTAKSRGIITAIEQVFATFAPPLTVRQVYYQLASRGLVPLSKSGYRQAQRLLVEVREAGIIPWEHFADRTRKRIQVGQWDDAADFVQTIRGAYRKDLWQGQADHVEFWLEKDALSSFVERELEEYGVPLYPMRGFSSVTFAHEGAVALSQITKPKYIYFLGDHDPSGESLEQALYERLATFGVTDVHFERLAIHLEDVATYDLLPLDAKTTDSRYRSYVERHGTTTVELDALPPDELRRRIREAVSRHIDTDEWMRLRLVEEAEQASITMLADRMLTGAP